MFGYVRAYKPDMKISEFETYKSVYCTLCKVLKKEYGVFAPAILSYDFTFLALLRLSISDKKVSYTQKRCAYNPLKKCMKSCVDSDEISYTAACLVLMFYYKLKDNLADKKISDKIIALVALPVFSRYRKMAMKKYEKLDNLFSECISQQKKLENESCNSLDKACDPTAKMLSIAFAREKDDDNTKRILKSLGYNAGKWVYLVDAYDDLKEDIKYKNYNPIIIKYHLDLVSDCLTAEENTLALINNCNVLLANDLELLELKRFKTILSNIIYQGLPDVIKNIKNKEK